jgi:D-alanine-D-alanine ligase
MKIAILHQQLSDDALPDERDVLTEVEAVHASLLRLGHTVEVIACGLDLGVLETKLDAYSPQLAFNLVESFGGTGRLQHVVPSFLDSRGYRYTGSSGEALMLTSHKLMTKDWLHRNGVPVPPSHHAAEGPCIVKPIAEDASIGIDDSSVVDSPSHADILLEEKGPGWFAEAYIPGREINVAILDGELLPLAEVRFEGDWSDKPQIVGYAAKWKTDSFEYKHTVRTILSDERALDYVRRVAHMCWDAFDLSGWARVDFRIDHRFKPYVLEVNANPCLSPDAGFAASVEAAGLTFDQAIDRILQASLRGIV